MANRKFNGDPIVEALRASHPKQGPDHGPGEPLDRWAERYMKYVRKKHGLKEENNV